MSEYATCDECKREMTVGGGCTATHLGTTSKGPWSQRVVFGSEPDDWGIERGHCHDCNAGVGQPHHFGCDVERCPRCGMQLISCECPWTHAAAIPTQQADPVVKVIWKDEGDFGFIQLVRLSDMDGHDPATTTWLEVLAERAARAKARGQTTLGVPYDPNRQRPAGTRSQAKALAREHNATLEEV